MNRLNDAIYVRERGRIEMHLASPLAHFMTIPGQWVDFERCETIHTENSYKYTPAPFVRLAAVAGFASNTSGQTKHVILVFYT